MERRGADDQIERLCGQRPCFKSGRHHLDIQEGCQGPPRDGRQFRAKLHRDDLVAALGASRVACPVPQAISSTRLPARRPVSCARSSRRRIAWARPLVALGILVEESLCRAAPLVAISAS